MNGTALDRPDILTRLAARWTTQPHSRFGRWLRELGIATPYLPRPHGLGFESVEKVLQIFALGFSGQTVTIKAARPKDLSPFTDTKVIYLPPVVEVFDEEPANFRLLKLMLIHQLFQIEHGTFDLQGQFGSFRDQDLAEDLFGIVESARIEQWILAFRGESADLAEARRDALSKRPTITKASLRTQVVEALVGWSLGGSLPDRLADKALMILEDGQHVLDETFAGAPRSADSLRVSTYLLNRIETLPGSYQSVLPVHYRGRIRLDLAQAVLGEQNRARGRRPPDDITVEHEATPGTLLKTKMADDIQLTPNKVIVREQIRVDGVGGQDSDDHAIALDLPAKRAATELPLTDNERQGAFVYDEWDYELGAYRPRWCALRERTVTPGKEGLIEDVLAKHRGLVTNLKRQFDALRPEYRRLRKQPDGEDIDLDSVVEAYADLRAGSTPGDNLYIDRRANRRDIGVVFLVDLSGSAGGYIRENRIVDIEREAIVLICEALQMLNDRYAIFGFSSSTRKQCDLFLVKDFGETYNQDVRLRISGLDTYSYTRMGPPIRHLSKRLDALDARIKLLILLSDGKPNDFDGYTGRYALEDTRQALAEARFRGIRTYCLTIDTRARDYLPQMFGEGGYSILDDVEKLPARLPDLYRRLTTR